MACVTALEAGRLGGARAVLDAGVHELEAAGAELRAAHASVYLAKVEVAEGNYEAAHAILLRSLRVLDGRDLIYGRLAALTEMAGLLVNTGRCEEAESMLREARILAQQGQDIDAQAFVEALEVKRRLLAGDPAGARSALTEFERLLTGGLVTRLSRIETLGFVAQCEAYGLAAGSRLEVLADSAVRADEPHARFVRAWLAAARALGDPRERGAALVGAAEDIRHALPGWGRAEAALLADWLEAEGRHRQGDARGAEELRARVRELAEKLPHAALVQLAS
jgi:tetratricopeptide (TPR) repeat protein